MRFTYFRFENFKGIEDLEIDLRRNPSANVYPLVGLNESGKTTILEAINLFAYKTESLDGLKLEGTKIEDLNAAIPISSRDNFTGYITIIGGVELNAEDKDLIKKTLIKELKVKSIKVGNEIIFTQQYYFKDSIYTPDKNNQLWEYDFKSISHANKTERVRHEDALKAWGLIKERIPNILYFPNFLFEFPDKIYLNDDITDSKEVFYRRIIQDILDSLDNNLNIKTHLVNRILSTEEHHKRNLLSVVGKMNRKLTEVIFKSWNKIFEKQISDKEILLIHGQDDRGVYLEFNITDGVDTYRIHERSLGFRWFFVFLLFTQFRHYHHERKNVFFLLDEPASNLHPSAQTQLLNSFSKLSKVIYTTHSHYLINPMWLENTFVVKNEAIDYSKEEDYNFKKTKITIHKYREFAVKYPNQSNYFQPILEVLDYAPSNLDMVGDIVMTEGKNDFYSLNYFQKIANPIQNPLSILPGTSASNLENIISLYLGWGKNFVIFLDSDGEGKKQKERYKDLFGKAIEDRIILYSDINSTWNNFKIESLFSEADKLVIQKECYPNENNFSQKIFHRSVQELLLIKKSIKLSNETNTNFEVVLEFLRLKLGQLASFVV